MEYHKIHKEIINWHKSGRNFKDGVEIFKKFSPNKVLLRRFERAGNIPFNMALLSEKLISHAQYIESIRAHKAKPIKSATKKAKKPDSPAKDIKNIKKPAATPEKPKQPGSKEVKPGTIDFETKPDKIRQLELEKVNLYIGANKIFNNQLPQAKTDAERAELAEAIVDKMKLNQDIWDKIHHYNKTKQLPEDDKPKKVEPDKQKKMDDLTPLQMQRKLTNRRSNISRYKNLISKNPNDSKNENRQAKIKEWEKEVEYYLEKLNK